MSPRFRRLSSDWKLYAAMAAFLSSGVAALTDLIARRGELISKSTELSPVTQWVVAGILLILTLLFLAAALSRRSVLLEPKRFLLSSDDPNHFVGRETEIQALARQCLQHRRSFSSVIQENGVCGAQQNESAVAPQK